LFLFSSFSASEDKQLVVVADDASALSHKRKRLRKPDTNIISIKFNRLLQPSKKKKHPFFVSKQFD